MKRSITSFALCSLFAMGVAIAAPQDATQNAPSDKQSQSWHRGEAPDPNRQVQMMTKRLNLTADQKHQLLPILTNRNQQIAALRSDTSLSNADRHAKMKSIRESTDSQIRGLLTDQQKQAYDQLLQERRERMQQKKHDKTA